MIDHEMRENWNLPMIEKRQGRDWEISYLAGDDPEEIMLVFGAMTIDEALRDAHQSLSSCYIFGIEPDYEIIAITRISEKSIG